MTQNGAHGSDSRGGLKEDFELQGTSDGYSTSRSLRVASFFQRGRQGCMSRQAVQEELISARVKTHFRWQADYSSAKGIACVKALAAETLGAARAALFV